MTPLEQMARDFAAAAHQAVGQKRKYTGESYEAHPQAVAEIVRSVPHTEAMLCAAHLHDVVEDTGVPLARIEDMFGFEVALLVEQLTDVSKPSDGNRAVRKRLDLEHTAKASPQAKTIKLADLIDNSSSILARDPGFARVYLREKIALLKVLVNGDQKLWARAHEIARVGLVQLD